MSNNSKCQVVKIDRAIWPDILEMFSDCNHQQTCEYVEKISTLQTGQHELITINRAGKLLGATAIRIKKVPLTGWGIAYVAGGPLVSRKGEFNVDNANLVLQALIEEYAFKRKLLLRIMPPINNFTQTRKWHELLVLNGISPIKSMSVYRTSLINLDKPMDDIRAEFHRKWRNHLNAGEKKRLTIVETSLEASLQTFEELFQVLKDRKKFKVSLTPRFYKDVEVASVDKSVYRVLLAKSENMIVGAHIGVYLGDTAIYLFGAATKEGYRLKAPYLLQWAALSLARDCGCLGYNTGGFDPVENPGVYEFKTRMNGTEIKLANGYQISCTRSAKIAELIEKLYYALKR